MTRGLAALLAVVLLAASCGGASAQDRTTLTVFAASSLTDAFTDLARTFEHRTGADVQINFAGSSTLATQIRRGAPADVFTSADRDQMQRVRQDGLVARGPTTFAMNRLVVVVPENNPAGIDRLGELAEPGIRLVLAAEEVPVTEYAEQVLEDAGSRYGQGFRPKVLGNLVSREADVRAALNRVAVGDADATFAYASDVTPDVRPKVRVVEIPPELNVVASYPMAVLTRADNKKRARQWMTFVLSDIGQRVLRTWGFRPVRSP